jgi:phosphatidylserine decarboxylase
MKTLFFSEEKLLNIILIASLIISFNYGLVLPIIIIIILYIFLILFYRDYSIDIDYNERTIYSPSSGTVLSATNDTIIIFLGVFDTHVQKFPINGTIKDITYKPGEFNLAYLLEKTVFNERVSTRIIDSNNEIITVVQVSGQLARRISYWKNPGDIVKAGENLGMIKFGSQVIINVPSGYTSLVKVNDYLSPGMPIFTLATKF